MVPGADAHGWVFDLVSVDADRRASALARHDALLRASARGQEWVNTVWRGAGSFTPADHGQAAQMRRARDAQRLPREQTVYGPLDVFCGLRPSIEPDTYERLGPFVLLFLQWERRFPEQWREAGSTTWSPWGTKELLLARLAGGEIPPQLHPYLVDLVCAAVAGPYRCKDWRYAAVARRVDSQVLRTRITALTDPADPSAGLRARFLLDVLTEPDAPITRRSWRRWLDTRPSRPA